MLFMTDALIVLLKVSTVICSVVRLLILLISSSQKYNRFMLVVLSVFGNRGLL